MLAPWKKSYDKPRQHIKKQRHYFADKGPSSQGYGFSSGHFWMWELEYKENWAPKNWRFWTEVLEKTLENPLDSKEITSVKPTGNQSWIFIGRTDAEIETPILWPPDGKNWCFLIVVLEKTLENLSDIREIQPVILNDPTSPECSLEGLMLKLK